MSHFIQDVYRTYRLNAVCMLFHPPDDVLIGGPEDLCTTCGFAEIYHDLVECLVYLEAAYEMIKLLEIGHAKSPREG